MPIFRGVRQGPTGALAEDKEGEGMSPKSRKSSTGLDENVAAFLSYLLGFVTGFVFYWEEKRSEFVKFHALQSIISFIPEISVS